MRGFRLGSALILLGVVILTVFLVTLTNEQGDPLTLTAGAALSALGLYLRRRNAKAAREQSYPSPHSIPRSEEDE